MKLIELITKISDNPEHDLRGLDILSKNNPHLSNPEPLHKITFFTPRQPAFTGNEEVIGDYFIFTYCGHDESMQLIELDSMQDMERLITGPSGISNVFTTRLTAIVKGKVKQFELNYQNEVTGEQVRFNKAAQLNSKNPFGIKYKNLQVKWLD